MVSKSTVRVRQLACSRREAVRWQRWLSNEKVSAEEIMTYRGQRLSPLVAGRHVLAIQDTSELNYQKHASRTRGLGTVGNGTDAGLFMHPVLAVDAESGDCLGLVGAELWLRTKTKASNYRAQPIEEKESHRWLRGAERAKRHLAAAAHVTMIADRESDIFEEWDRLPDERFDLLTRACRDRAIDGGGTLFAFTDRLPEVYCYERDLPARPGKRTARRAKLALRLGEVTIKRPRHCSDPYAAEAITLSVVDVREIDPPGNGEEPVHWRLLTTHRIDGVEDALCLIAWYCWRWHIEQLFRTVKRQGLDLEASQLESAAALLRLAALALQAATRCMQLVLARNGAGNQPATAVFEPDDIPVLAALQPTLEGSTDKQRNSFTPETLAWAAWIIARLGGWKGYRSESPPGPITMHHGLTQFAAIAHGWHLANPRGKTRLGPVPDLCQD